MIAGTLSSETVPMYRSIPDTYMSGAKRKMACRRRNRERSIHIILCASVRGATGGNLRPPKLPPSFAPRRCILGDLLGEAGGDSVPPPPFATAAPLPPLPMLPTRMYAWLGIIILTLSADACLLCRPPFAHLPRLILAFGTEKAKKERGGMRKVDRRRGTLAHVTPEWQCFSTRDGSSGFLSRDSYKITQSAAFLPKRGLDHACTGYLD